MADWGHWERDCGILEAAVVEGRKRWIRAGVAPDLVERLAVADMTGAAGMRVVAVSRTVPGDPCKKKAV